MRLLMFLLCLVALAAPLAVMGTGTDGVLIRDSDCHKSGHDDDDDGFVDERSFALINDTSEPICEVKLTAVIDTDKTGDDDDDDGCSAGQCNAPDGWSCYVANGRAFYTADSLADCIAPGATLDGFEWIAAAGDDDDDGCCFRVKVKDDKGDVLFRVINCFCSAVSTEQENWGTLKVRFEE